MQNCIFKRITRDILLSIIIRAHQTSRSGRNSRAISAEVTLPRLQSEIKVALFLFASPSFLANNLRFIDLSILKNMGATIIDFRVCPPLVKCQNIMFSGFIDTLMYGFSSTGVTIYCYFGLKFNDNTCCEVIYKRRYNNNDIMTTNKLPGMYFFF